MSENKPFALDHYRLLGRSGLRVSPFCLGTMTFGTEWGFGSDKETARRQFDIYSDRGGNFIDTADLYTLGTSEKWVGEFVAGKRHRYVVATKFSFATEQGNPNSGGNHRKNIVESVEASLQRLGTDYIDLYWMHVWEGRTPIDETMRALDDLVRAGKVLYVGASDSPAWKVAQANTLAELRGWSPFIGLQVEYSLIERTPERDLLPMARDLGLGVTPWSPLASGILTGKYNQPDDGAPRRTDWTKNRLTRKNLAIAANAMKIGEQIGRTAGQVALNWLLYRPGVVSPILGARTVEQLEENLGALDFTLTKPQRKQLDRIGKIEPGFPHSFIEQEYVQNLISAKTQIESREP